MDSGFSLREFGLLASRLRVWSRAGLSRAVGLATVAAFADVVGFVALVPLVTLVLGGRGGGMSARFFEILTSIGLNSDRAQIAAAMVVFLSIMLARSYAVMLREGAILRLQSGYTAYLQTSVMERLARAPWQKVEALQHARITQAIGVDVMRAGGSAQLLLQIVGAVLVLLMQWALALAIAPVIAILALAICALAAAGFARSLVATGSIGAAINRRGLSVAHVAQQFLGGLKLAKAQNAEAGFSAEFARVTHEILDLRNGYLLRQIKNRQQLTFAAAAGGGVFLLVGKWAGLDAPHLLASFAVMTRISAAGTTLIQLLQQIATQISSHTSLVALIDELEGRGGIVVAAQGAPPGPSPLGRLEAGADLIRLDRVGYRVGASVRVKDVSLRIGVGEAVALTGESGAGKTTLIDLMTGLLTPTSGSILVHGQPLDGAHGVAWRDRIAYVTQETWLMNDTIRANLVWGAGAISEDRMWRALAIAGADTLVRQSEGGLDTRVNEQGMRFSGGERQRLALARAILREPEVLILDEATNAMDAESERAMFTRLLAAMPSLSLLVIAHRPSTLEVCRRIIHLQDGAISEGQPV